MKRLQLSEVGIIYPGAIAHADGVPIFEAGSIPDAAIGRQIIPSPTVTRRDGPKRGEGMQRSGVVKL